MMHHPHLVDMNRIARDRVKLVREWLPLDVPAFVEQVKALPVFKDCPVSIAKTEVRIVYSAFSSGGRAHGNRLARIRVSPSTPLVWLLETIVHELVHCALPRRVSHNERFRRTLARAAKELWGIEVDPNPKNENGKTLCYALDSEIERALHAALDAGTLVYPKRDVPTEKAREAQNKATREARIEQRAAHAARMLARAETRLKRAKTLERKWRLKVQRYERIAAKERS